MKARRVKRLDSGATLADSTARIVRVRLRELRSFVPKAQKPDRTKEQHNMRIAAKRLRYVLEMLGFCLGPAADPARHEARELQQLLGEIHDCDVMLPRVNAELDALRRSDVQALRKASGAARDLDPKLAARAPNRAAYRGLETLAVYLRSRRELLFERFLELWAKQESTRTWERLEAAAEAQLLRSKERRLELAAANGEGDLPLGIKTQDNARAGGPGGVESPLDADVR
jgi:hypothetical protein